VNKNPDTNVHSHYLYIISLVVSQAGLRFVRYHCWKEKKMKTLEQIRQLGKELWIVSMLATWFIRI